MKSLRSMVLIYTSYKKSLGHAIVLTTAPSHPQGAAWDLEEAARFGRSAAGADVPSVAGRRPPTGPRVEVVSLLEAALERARELAGHGTVVVAGSCHVVGDARSILALDDPRRS